MQLKMIIQHIKIFLSKSFIIKFGYYRHYIDKIAIKSGLIHISKKAVAINTNNIFLCFLKNSITLPLCHYQHSTINKFIVQEL